MLSWMSRRKVLTLVPRLRFMRSWVILQEGLRNYPDSSEMPEILGMSDRIVVMCNGRKTGELGRGEATQEMILELAMEKGTTGKGAAK